MKTLFTIILVLVNVTFGVNIGYAANSTNEMNAATFYFVDEYEVNDDCESSNIIIDLDK